MDIFGHGKIIYACGCEKSCLCPDAWKLVSESAEKCLDCSSKELITDYEALARTGAILRENEE